MGPLLCTTVRGTRGTVPLMMPYTPASLGAELKAKMDEAYDSLMASDEPLTADELSCMPLNLHGRPHWGSHSCRRGGAKHARETIKKFQLRSSRSEKLIRQSRKSAREALAIAKRKTLLIRNPRKLAVRRASSHVASNAVAGVQSKYRPHSTSRSPFQSSHTTVPLSHNRSIEVVPRKTPQKRTASDKRPEWSSSWNNKIHR